MHRHEAGNIKQVDLDSNDKDYRCIQAVFLESIRKGGKVGKVKVLTVSFPHYEQHRHVTNAVATVCEVVA